MPGSGSLVVAVHHAVVAGAAAALVALAVALFLLWRRRRRAASARGAGGGGSGAAVPAALPVFPLADVERATDGFHPSRVLGQGRHFAVYAAAPGLAAKRMHPHLVLGDPGGCRFPAAVRSLAVPAHRNLVAFVGLSEGPGERVLLVERAPAGSVSLDALLHGGGAQNQPVLTWHHRAAVAAGAARGLAHLHAHGVVHGRVRPCNVLVDADAAARGRHASRVSDYGLAGFLHHHDDNEGGDGGKDHLDVRAENDVYMFGALLLELLTGRRWEGGRLAEWALPRIRTGTAAEVADARAGAAADKAEARLLGRVARVALACVGNVDGRSRPGMAEVSAILDDVEASYRRRSGAAALDDDEDEEQQEEHADDGVEGRLSGCLLGQRRRSGGVHKADTLLRPPV